MVQWDSWIRKRLLRLSFGPLRVVLVSTGFLLCAPANSARAAADSARINWSSPVKISDGRWGRMVKLSDGDRLSVATISPGRTNRCLALYQSTNACRDWTPLSRVSEPARTVDNGELVELPNGTLLLSMRSLIAGQSYHLPVYSSADRGRTWHYLSNIDSSEGNGPHGIWEPDFQVLKDGRGRASRRSQRRHRDLNRQSISSHVIAASQNR